MVIFTYIPYSQHISPPSSVYLSISGGSIRAVSGPSMAVNETVVDTIILAVDGNDKVVDEIVGAKMEF